MLSSRKLKWRIRLILSNALLPTQVSRRHLRQTSRHRPHLSKISSFTNMKNSSQQSSIQIEVKKYTYTPLDSTEGSIRLLRLLPAADASAPLQCSLFYANLADAPRYVALSYAWGDRSSKQYISIGGESVAVTASLKHALKRLRLKAGELVMWVDAICINQEDIPERNVQTQNMRSVYQNAESVAVWLGTEYNESKEAIQIARDLNYCSSREEVRHVVSDPEREGDLRALVGLFRRQYWWRIWVIQEVSCGRRSMVYCGEEEIPWDELDNVCNILKEEEDILQSLFYKNYFSYTRTLITGGPRGLQLSRYSPGAAVPPLLELLISHKSKKSSDPKDKVYALVGISSSRQNFGKIDYSRPLSEIYTHTARHIISDTRKLDVICVKQHDVPEPGLPSWAPNWARAPNSSGPTVIGLHHREPEFTAAGNSLAEVEFVSNGSVLRARGAIIDRVKITSMPLKKKGSPGDAVPLLHVFHDWWNLFVTEHSTSPSAQAVFARTISCGNWMFEDEDSYALKLEAIFTLSDDLLSDSGFLRLDPPSRTSTISRSVTMSNSIVSLPEDEEEDITTDPEEKEQLSTILSASLAMNRRRLLLSRNGLVGLGPWNAVEGDLIVVLLGCRFPVILRRQKDVLEVGRFPAILRRGEERYVLVGEAYVDGFMSGEAVDGLKGGSYSLDTFDIQ